MPGFTQHRLTTALARDVLGIPCEPGVVNDRLRSQTRQKGLSQKPYDVIALNESSIAIEEEAAIKITIPGNSEICPRGAHGVRGRSAIFYQQRVGHAVGEMAIRLMVDLKKLEWQMWLQRIDDPTRTAITRRTNDLKRLERGYIDIGEQVRDIGSARIGTLERPAGLRRGECVLLSKRANLTEP